MVPQMASFRNLRPTVFRTNLKLAAITTRMRETGDRRRAFINGSFFCSASEYVWEDGTIGWWRPSEAMMEARTVKAAGRDRPGGLGWDCLEMVGGILVTGRGYATSMEARSS